MQDFEAIVVGAGIGGLSAAVRLAAAGVRVGVIERGDEVGGKMRVVEIEGQSIDSGPTVFTMPQVFRDLFGSFGASVEDFVTLDPVEVLARHAWVDGSRLDLFADPAKSAEAITAFAGRREAEGYRRFLAHSERIYAAVREPFIEAESVRGLSSVMKAGVGAAWGMLKVDWHRTLWRSLGSFFRDPRLRQLFARYATYYGSNPFQAPGTLSVIAHVEQAGVYTVRGGMIELARGLRRALEGLGGQVLLNTSVAEVELEAGVARAVVLHDGTRLSADAFIVNVDPGAIARGVLGQGLAGAVDAPKRVQRSLSAITVSMLARPRKFPLAWHNVFFSSDYAREFKEIFSEQRLPTEPTVYICAQDRGVGVRDTEAPERIFLLVNAPATGDHHDFSPETESCLHRTFQLLERCGLELEGAESQRVITTPNDFERMFPATGGALYGPATHGAMAPFSRPNPQTKLRNLYLVGGGVHPGAGVPMVALGGKAAASALMRDHPSISRSNREATPGGTSTPSAMMDAKVSR